jgi:ABC-type transport system involved in multi-copper enzyme maturation permease subunit
MSLFFNIRTIAKYEMKVLSRSWFFRIFTILALVFLFFFNLVTQTDVDGSAQWSIIAIPAAIPLTSLFFLNIGQAVIVIFLASDFLKRDKNLDTAEVVYTKPVSNFDYVFGKVLGNLMVFLILDLILLLMVAIFNLLAEDTDLDIAAYFEYLILLILPSLVFILGLSFMIMSLVKNQAITFIILLAYVAVTLFYLKTKVFFLFDYMAFKFPMLKSDITGFSHPEEILTHRGIYFMIGLGFLFFTVVLLKRNLQSRTEGYLSVLFGTLALTFGIYLSYAHVSRYLDKKQIKEQLISINNKLAGENMADIIQHHIDFEHKGKQFRSTSDIVFRNSNKEALKDIILNLNPGLKVKKVNQYGKSVPFTRELHILYISLPDSLFPGDTVSVNITYEGTPDYAICYPDLDTLKKQTSDDLQNIRADFGFVTPDYVLLTPEVLWYPVSGVTYSTKNPEWLRKDFTKFSLHVETTNGLIPVSQGRDTIIGEGVDFIPEHPLTCISLAIGQFEKRTLVADSIEFRVFSVKGHDYFVDALPELKDTIGAILTERLHDYERKINLEYPFNRFSLVEVPVQFSSFQRLWTGDFEAVQPEMVLFPEKGATVRHSDLKGYYKRYKKWSKWSNEKLTDREYMVNSLNSFFGVFTSVSGSVNWRNGQGPTETINEYNIFPEFFNFQVYFNTEKWPIFNRILESYLKNKAGENENTWLRQYTGISEDEQANMALQENSFAEILSDPEQKQIIDNVIKLKGDVLFSVIKSKAGDDNFDKFLHGWVESSKFSKSDFTNFSANLEQDFGLDLEKYMQTWFYEKKLPGFLITRVKAEKIKSGDRMETMVSLRISNPEDTEGVIKLSFQFEDRVEKIVLLDKGQTKDLSYLFDDEPRSISFFTLTSKNIPIRMEIGFSKIEENKSGVAFEGERIVNNDLLNQNSENEIIVDNEDPGFSVIEPATQGLLFKLLMKSTKSKQKYSGFSWRTPINWTLTTNDAFYGKYVKSAEFVRAGTGDHKAIWKVRVKEASFYDVYYYINQEKFKRWSRGKPGQYQFVISHNNETDEPLLSLRNSEPGWNNLGSYYFSADTAVIELTNKSDGRIVVADAIKLVK